MIQEKELNKLKSETPLAERKYRVGSTWSREGKQFGLMLTYIDARYVMDRLDEVVGIGNWKSEFHELRNRLFCTITITFLREDGVVDTISKTDCGVESNVEKEKGEVSDAFKRCAVHFGIGRDLYSNTDPRKYITELTNGKAPFGWKPQQ